MNIIFLAGGSSTRFAPLKEKNLYKFLGKSVPEYQISKLKNILDFDQLVVITNSENLGIVQNELSDYEDIKIVSQEGDGQVAAVLTGIRNLENDSDLLIINMNDFFEDSLFESFVMKLDSLREKQNCMLTGFKVDKYFPGGYLVINDKGLVTEVQEKPGEGNEPSDFVRIVFDYFRSSDELEKYLNEAKSEQDDLYEVAMSDMMGKNIGFEMLESSGKWATIKYPWHVLNVMNFFLEKIEGQQIHESVQIAENVVIKGDVIIEEGVKIFEGAAISGPVFIGKNSIIGNNALVRESIIGEGSVVGYCSEVARSYLKSNVWLHKNYIGDSVIEDNVSFGSNSLTANFRLDEGEISVNVKGDKIGSQRTKLGAIIASNVRIGVATNVMPGTKIGRGSFIGAGMNLSEDVEDGKFVYMKNGEMKVKDNEVDISQVNRDEHKGKLVDS